MPPALTWAFCGALRSIGRSLLGGMRTRPLFFNRLKNYTNPAVQNIGNTPQHAERMAFVVGGFEPAYLLLRFFTALARSCCESPACLRRLAICRATSQACPA